LLLNVIELFSQSRREESKEKIRKDSSKGKAKKARRAKAFSQTKEMP